jgi:hypothetical protein
MVIWIITKMETKLSYLIMIKYKILELYFSVKMYVL